MTDAVFAIQQTGPRTIDYGCDDETDEKTARWKKPLNDELTRVQSSQDGDAALALAASPSVRSIRRYDEGAQLSYRSFFFFSSIVTHGLNIYFFQTSAIYRAVFKA
jgi:hypothetical protein